MQQRPLTGIFTALGKHLLPKKLKIFLFAFLLRLTKCSTTYFSHCIGAHTMNFKEECVSDHAWCHSFWAPLRPVLSVHTFEDGLCAAKGLIKPTRVGSSPKQRVQQNCPVRRSLLQGVPDKFEPVATSGALNVMHYDGPRPPLLSSPPIFRVDKLQHSIGDGVAFLCM